MSINGGNRSSSIIKFNVGGQFYQSSYDTVMRYNTMLKSLVEHKQIVKCDEENRILIDRDGYIFRHILNFMRDGKIFLPDSVNSIKEIIHEAEFYAFEELQIFCNLHLKKFIHSDLSSTLQCIYSNSEKHEAIKTYKSMIMLSFNDDIKNLDPISSKLFLSGVVFFHQMSRVYWKFKFIIDNTQHRNREFKFDFYNNGSCLTSVPFVHILNSGYNSLKLIPFPGFLGCFDSSMNILLAANEYNVEDSLKFIHNARSDLLETLNQFSPQIVARQRTFVELMEVGNAYRTPPPDASLQTFFRSATFRYN